MLDDRVLNMLMKTTEIEKAQLRTFEFQNDIPQEARESAKLSTQNEMMLNDYFFRTSNIYISKHNRYAPYPTHTHTFLEINYMLRGECDELVDGKNIHLNTGDLLLLDVGSKHSIGYLGSNDLLINILFQDRTVNIDLLNDMRSSQNVLYDFLLNRKIGAHSRMSYLLFQRKNGGEIQETLDKIMDEYYLKNDYSDSIISAYLQVLIAQLVRNYDLKIDDKLSKKQQVIAQILKDINDNYSSITLDGEAKKYRYNRNYLSNLFKEEVGERFSKVVTKQKIINAHGMLDSTNIPITQVMKLVGITNRTFFYKKYEEQYHKLPSKGRK